MICKTVRKYFVATMCFFAVFFFLNFSIANNNKAATVLKNNPYAWQTIALKPESLIGPENGSYAIFSLPSTFYYAFDFGPPIRGGEFIGAGEQFIGMYFKINNNIHFGWMRIVLGNYGNEFTVIDAAYNTIPKFPIIAGATD